MHQFDWAILWSDGGLRLLQGLQVTLRLAGTSLVLALVIGLVVGLLRWLGGRLVGPVCWLYVEFARNTPPLVQILFWYFSAGFLLPGFAIHWLREIGFEFGAAVIALSLYHGAFIAEVVRAGLNSIHRGQYDAARALGLSFVQMMRAVIFPQAIRIIVPPLTNEAVGLVKGTSLALAIGVTEISYQAKYIDTYAFRGVEALVGATVLYLALCLCIAALGHLVAARFSRASGRAA